MNGKVGGMVPQNRLEQASRLKPIRPGCLGEEESSGSSWLVVKSSTCICAAHLYSKTSRNSLLDYGSGALGLKGIPARTNPFIGLWSSDCCSEDPYREEERLERCSSHLKTNLDHLSTRTLHAIRAHCTLILMLHVHCPLHLQIK